MSVVTLAPDELELTADSDLFALFRGRDRTVVRETYASSSTTGPGTRNVTTGTASDDRMNLNSRAASGTGTQSGINDPNARQ